MGLAGAGASAAFLAACGSDDGDGGGGNASKPTTIEWWHISNTDPGLTILANLAKEYEAAHSNVKIKVTPLENEAFKAKLTTVTQSGNPPDIFHSWGGGVLKQQSEAGLVKDLTSGVSSWIGDINKHAVEIYQVDGKQYGIPFDLGMVGFWYNKDLFTKASIAAPPTTWTEFLDVVRKLKAAGVTPIVVGGGEKWPAMYYWAYLAMRQAGVDGVAEAAKTGAFDGPDFVTAGERLKELVDLKPFNNGFLATKYSATDGEAGIMGNGQAAMELMGQWAPSAEMSYSTSKKGLGDKLGFFPFPAVEGGKGSAGDAFGGGNGYAVGKNAPDAAVDFLKFLHTVDSQKKMVAGGGMIPVTQGAEASLTDPNLKVVQETVAKAPEFQLYLDQAYAPAIGQQVNDSVAELIAGKASPKQVADAIAKVAKSETN
jgi:raffinose/stachyose/melibiose transport system substrate-binding protein